MESFPRNVKNKLGTDSVPFSSSSQAAEAPLHAARAFRTNDFKSSLFHHSCSIHLYVSGQAQRRYSEKASKKVRYHLLQERRRCSCFLNSEFPKFRRQTQIPGWKKADTSLNIPYICPRVVFFIVKDGIFHWKYSWEKDTFTQLQCMHTSRWDTKVKSRLETTWEKLEIFPTGDMRLITFV